MDVDGRDEYELLLYRYVRYDPLHDHAIGRFLQRDPIGIRGGLNVYAYVRNSPVAYIDSSGLSFAWGGWGCAGTIASVGTVLVLLPAEYIIKPAIDRRNARIERQGGDPRFRAPFNPDDPWDWAKGTSWEKQRRKWRKKHRVSRRCRVRRVPAPVCFTRVI